MENEITSTKTSTWLWIIAGAIIAYVVYKSMFKTSSSGGGTTVIQSQPAQNDASAISSALSQLQQSDQAALSSMSSAITQGFQSVLTGQTSLASGISDMFTTEAAGIKKLFDGMSATLADDFKAMNDAIGKDFSSLETDISGLSKSLKTSFTSLETDITNLSTSQQSGFAAQSTAAAYSAGASAFTAIKAVLGGENTTADAISKTLPNCVKGNNIDFQCLGQAIISGKTSIGDIVHAKGSFQLPGGG